MQHLERVIDGRRGYDVRVPAGLYAGDTFVFIGTPQSPLDADERISVTVPRGVRSGDLIHVRPTDKHGADKHGAALTSDSASNSASSSGFSSAVPRKSTRRSVGRRGFRRRGVQTSD